MTNVEIVRDNPNSKAMTFSVDADLLGPYAKVIIPTNDAAMVELSPLAKAVQGMQTFSRVDFAFQDDKTRITLTGKSDLPPAYTETFRGYLQTAFFEASVPVLLTDKLQQSALPVHTSFIPNGPIQFLVAQTFNSAVNPILADDGGAMQLLNVVQENDGRVYAEVALMGACNGCAQSTTGTLEGATGLLKRTFTTVKEQNPDNPDVQKLEFTEIRIVDVPALLFSRD